MAAGDELRASLIAVTVPLTGEYNSLTALEDSSSPHTSPAVTLSPTDGNSTNTTSPRAFAACSVMPTVTTEPGSTSPSTHSCSVEYRRSAGIEGMATAFRQRYAGLASLRGP